MTRKRPRKARIRREPIDLEQLAAEFADLPEPQAAALEEPQVDEPRIDEQEILVALQAEVQRVTAARAEEIEVVPVAVAPLEPVVELEPEPVVDLEPEPALELDPEPVVADPFGIVSETDHASAGRGLPLDQMRAWLEQVQEDLERIQTRLQYLEAEQTRLQQQHHLVAELLTSSTPS